MAPFRSQLPKVCFTLMHSNSLLIVELQLPLTTSITLFFWEKGFWIWVQMLWTYVPLEWGEWEGWKQKGELWLFGDKHILIYWKNIPEHWDVSLFALFSRKNTCPGQPLLICSKLVTKGSLRELWVADSKG